jgi:hypothetical protein
MARGRMISKSLSTSERFAALHDHAGKLAEFCQSLYPLLLAHADDWGCQQGDVFTIKHLVHPTSPRRLLEFETALMHLHNTRLIAWYQVEDKWIVAVRGFSAHQTLKGHDKDGRKRPFPPPPENLSNFVVSAQSCPSVPKVALRELKRTELKRTELIGRDGADAPEVDEKRKAENLEIRDFLRAFCDLYEQYRNGAKYAIVAKKHVPLVRRMLALHGSERLRRLAGVMLKTDDDWISSTDRGIGILSEKLNWLNDKLTAWEAKRGQVA